MKWSETPKGGQRLCSYKFPPSVMIVSISSYLMGQFCLRLSLWLWDAGLNSLDVLSTETGGGTLVLGTSEARTDRTLQSRDGCAHRGLPLSRGRRRCRSSSSGSHVY